jgi:hypothetical protein
MTYFENEIVTKYLKLESPEGCSRDTQCHSNRAPVFDVANPTSSANYKSALTYVSCGSPRQSELLTKPLAGEDGHEGGDFFQPGSPEMLTFMMWFP